MDDLDTILEELTENDFVAVEIITTEISQQPNSPAEKESALMSLLNEVCFELGRDECIPQDLRSWYTSLQGNEMLLQHLQFLDSCLFVKGKFCNANQEKAWATFHSKYQENMGSLSGFFKHPGASHLLCLTMFEHLMKKSVVQQPGLEQGSLNEDDIDIVHYVGGSIVSKIMKSMKKLNEQSSQSYLEVLDCMIRMEANTESGNASCTLTDALDRGGLKHLKPLSLAFFTLLESAFRITFPHPISTKFDFDKFKNFCMPNVEITDAFNASCSKSQSSDETKVNILVHILKLYFKIRTHRKCKHFVDNMKFAKKVYGKQKGLRKVLKKGSESVQQSADALL